MSGKCSDEATHLKDCDRVKTEQNIRAMILCLSSRMAELGKIRPKIKEVSETNYSFNFRIHTSEEGAQYLSDDIRWGKVPSNPPQPLEEGNDTDNSSSPSFIGDSDVEGESTFSICDMVRKKVQTHQGQEEKGEKSKHEFISADSRTLTKNNTCLSPHTLRGQDKSEDERDFNDSSVIVPVYRFDVPFNLTVLVEYFES